MTPPAGPLLRLRELVWQPGGIDVASLDVADGETVALLGPPGGGKTALLNLIVGLAAPRGGQVELAGTNLLALRPDLRGVGLVAAAPQLFMPMTIAGNVALADRRGEPRAALLLERLGLRGVAQRRPPGLAMAVQLRAAIARALAAAPRLLLLDDPQRGCEAALWPALRADLSRLRAELGFTLMIAARELGDLAPDRIAVMARGTIVQAGTPRALHERPASAVVARCLGEVNRLTGRLQAIHDEEIAEVRLAGGETVEAMLADAGPVGAACDILVRPDRIAVAAAAAAELGPGAVPARLAGADDRGDHVLLHLAIGGDVIVVRRPTAPAIRPGGTLAVAWQTSHAWACRPGSSRAPASFAPRAALAPQSGSV